MRAVLMGFLVTVGGCGEGTVGGTAAAAAGANGAGTAAGGASALGGSGANVAGANPNGAGTAAGGVATSAGTNAGGGGSAGNGGTGAGTGGVAVVPDAVVCGDATCDLSESCTSCAQDCGACPSLPAFGNTDIHPQKFDIYMSPDIAAGWLVWETTDRSLAKYHELLPDAWIRWDNETGHGTSTPDNVEKFVSLADKNNVPMIIAASAVPGYDNFWALNYGKMAGQPDKQVTITIKNIGDGPYLAHAYGLLQKHKNVKFVETINEPDGVWFVGDYDNTDSWDYYLKKLYAATNDDYDHILGPATAFQNGKIYNFHAGRAELKNYSYHTYSGWEGLHEIGDKAVYITEYGYKLSNHATELQAQSPALNLQDLWQIEKHAKLGGKVARISYVYLHTMMLGDVMVGDHHAFTGFFLAMASYSALGKISKNAYLDDTHPDFIASDDGEGHFGVMLWNTSESQPMNGEKRIIANVSVGAGAKLYALRMAAWGAPAGGECKPLTEQTWVSVNQQGHTLELTANAIPPLEAVYLSSQPCKNFVN